jgi:putative ABC transport system permease protein
VTKQMETLWRDIRYSIRLLFKNKVVTLVALVALALGIGANTAIFSVINAVLLKRLPYKDADQLVVIWEKLKQVDQVELSPGDFAAYSERGRSFTHIAASERANFNLTGIDEPVRLEGQRATANLFETLGFTATLGRTFTDEEDRTNARVAVLSSRLWRNRFAGDPQIVGREIALNGSNYTVIGVMPAEFLYPAPINNTKPGEIWTPRSLSTERERGAHNLLTIGRLRPGISWEQARSEFELISRQRSQELSKGEDGHRVNLVPLTAQVGRQQRTALYVLVGAVGLVLLIACANVANLLLTLAAGRRKEIALRLALGAKRSGIIRQLLTESLLLSLVGGGIGLLVAVWLSRAIRVLSLGQIPRAESIEVDSSVLAFTILVSVATGLIFGMAPALQASRTDLNSTLKDGARGTIGAGGHRLRSALVIGEVALSLLLLAGAGLMIKSFWRLQQVDPGFNPQNLLSVEVTLPATRYPESQQRTAFFQQVLERVSTLPGVSAAAVVNSPPLSGRRNIDIFPIEGHPEPKGISDAPLADFRLISPDYFRMMGIPMLQGRGFTEGDAQNTAKVTIVSQAFATKFGAGENMLGKRLRVGNDWHTVIGVVSDIRQSGLDEAAAPHVYVSYNQAGPTRAGLLVRTTTDPLSLVAAVRGQIQAVDRDQPIYNVNTMSAMIAAAVAPRRLNLVLLGSFAALALALAAVGIYGVMANLVTQRTGEIGLRMALGAQQVDVLRLVIGRGLRLTLVGMAVGLGASFALMRLMASLLFGVSANDPFTFAAITVLLLLVALLACYMPARRATKVDPLVALRYE